MSDLSEALALVKAAAEADHEDWRGALADRVEAWSVILAAARNWHTLTNPTGDKTMRVFGSVEDMKQARKQLGSPAALNEALVATGIDALFFLLDGGSVEIEGRRLALVDALTDTAEEDV